MKLEAMRIFAEVVKHGGFTHAAAHLNVSKGYVSQQVSSLEKQLNKQLLFRNTRSMRLTSAGEVVYAQALKLTVFFEQTKSMLDASESMPSGQVNITAPVGVAQHLIWPHINQLRKTFPGITFDLDCGNTKHNLTEDNFDIAVRLTNSPPVDMVGRHLVDIPYLCVASPDYLKLKGTPAAPTDLEAHDILALAHWKRWSFFDGKTVNLDLTPSVSASDNHILRSLCINGGGIGRFPFYMIEQALAKGELIEILPEYSNEERGLYLIYPQMTQRPQRVQVAIDAIIAGFDNANDGSVLDKLV